jgi:6,7-dimethyl-8-ribityllumazine synthase
LKPESTSSVAGEHANATVGSRRFAIVVSRYHDSITQKLLDGALETLHAHAVPDAQICVLWVPGAWEIPFAVQRVLQSRQLDAVICLGCVIRGETTHDQHLNTTVSNSLGRLGLDNGVPVAFGVLTCNSMEQAIARSGGEVGNKGVESATAVIELLQLFDSM